ncbi:acetamidase/formamidase [Klebsormidium nitens]|uniref:Acetamidase/formamidase n=1 Tax=Klebsormidium nitens TaxID=105231 RepID=A0A1Y1HS94_KLENI|nr:acetamidase/formamidase [Klebsormidium nitens]|eukprot:GAQ81500.1 acetamidase/formamidase [Klebsormidium nitens]
MASLCAAGALALLLLVTVAHAQDICTQPSTTYLAANSKTVIHGVFSPTFAPVAHVKSGDTLVAECVTTNSNADYPKFVKGDPGVEDIFYWPNGVSKLNKSVPQYPNSGGHFLTGPVQVCGAEPGDVLKVEILDVVPRPNPSTGRTWGMNYQGASYTKDYIGTRFGDYNFTQDNYTQIVYEVLSDEFGDWVEPVYMVEVPKYIGPDGKDGTFFNGSVAMMPFPTNVGVPPADFVPSLFQDPRTFPAENVTYPPGFQSSLADGATLKYIDTATLNWRVPQRQHYGVFGVTPANAAKYQATAVNGSLGAGSAPPSKFGGNMDQIRVAKGTTVYLTVQIPGAGWTFGDCHAAEGDGETSSSAVEASNTGTFRFTLIKKADLTPGLASLTGPLLETKEYFHLQGFSYEDYIEEVPVPSKVGNASLGEDLNKPMRTATGKLATSNFVLPVPVPSKVGNASLGEDLNKPMKDCYKKTRNFLMDSFNLEERETLALMSVGVDFGITEVVDGVWGIHSTIPKLAFSRRYATKTQGNTPVGGPISLRKLQSAKPSAREVFNPTYDELVEAYTKMHGEVSFNRGPRN